MTHTTATTIGPCHILRANCLDALASLPTPPGGFDASSPTRPTAAAGAQPQSGTGRPLINMCRQAPKLPITSTLRVR